MKTQHNKNIVISFFMFVAYTLISVWGTADGSENNKCLAAFDSSDFITAERFCRPIAESGNPDAQFYMAMMYLHGKGVSQNESEAFKWFQQAAKQNHAKAINNLGAMYFQGSGVGKNYTKAIEYFKKAANAGAADAQYNLGVMYDKGIGVKHDSSTAFKWYKKAAEQGQFLAQYNLGNMYRKGEGTAKDFTESFLWYRKSADQENADAEYQLGHIYHDGIGTAKNFTKAYEWYKKAADRNHGDAQINLGLMLEKGEGISKDSAEAAKWFREAAEQGIPDGQYKLGVMLTYGEGVPKDYVSAYSWFSLAELKHHKEATTAMSALSGRMSEVQIKSARSMLATRMVNICELQETFSRLGLYGEEINGYTNPAIKNIAVKFLPDNRISNDPFNLDGIVRNVRNNPKIIDALKKSSGGIGRTVIPKSGDVFDDHLTGSLAPLQIATSSTGSHFFIKVQDTVDNGKYRTYFIRGGETIDTKVPLGTYAIKYVTGVNWYGENCLFGSESRFSKTDRTFTFKRDDNKLRGYRVELILQKDGNLSTSKIDRSQF